MSETTTDTILTVTAEELLEAGGISGMVVCLEDPAQVNLVANILDKLTRARLRKMDAGERQGKLLKRGDFDAALSAVYGTVESECGPRTWLALKDAGADYEQARNIMLEIQDRIYQQVIAYGTADTPAE